MKRIAIVGAKRTPIGAFQGQFQSLKAQELGAFAIKGALEQSGIDPEQVESCLMGNVLSAGLGQAPARQAALKAGLPQSVNCTTVNKVCGSGMKTAIMGGDMIRAGSVGVAIAGGMESMSQAPYLLPDARSGMRMGNKSAIDSMVHDGLWDPYDNTHVGNCGELLAEKYDFSREAQDSFAAESLARAQKAVANNTFSAEIVPVEVTSRKGSTLYDTDEQPGLGKPEKIQGLRPAFKKDGTITAANASSINDGAAALVLASEEKVSELGLNPLAWITDYAEYSMEPRFFTLAPVHAVKKLLEKNGMTPNDIDLWEINEAFAVVSMAVLKDCNLSHDSVNVFGGACALGHPIGCSGTRILVTLINALKTRNKKRGMASLCIGGGEATAMTVELA